MKCKLITHKPAHPSLPFMYEIRVGDRQAMLDPDYERVFNTFKDVKHHIDEMEAENEYRH